MTDILLNSDLDIDFSSGDLSLGISDDQQKKILLLAEKGSFKESPEVGVGLANYLEAEDPSNLLREIRIQHTNDGMQVKTVQFDDQGKLNVDANYTS